MKIREVVKNDGSVEPFDPNKLIRWADYACKYGGDWNDIARSVYQMLPERASSADIHESMTKVCSDKGDLIHSRIAARLELARIRKNMERVVGVKDNQPFTEIFKAFIDNGVWDANVMPKVDEDWNSWFLEGKENRKEFWELVQWGDKYSAKKDGEPFEVPHAAMLANALALFPDDKERAKTAYLEGIKGSLMSPTPALNGLRNGDFDTISCSLIEGGDSVESIEVANHLAMRMTAKKAGIGITHNTRSKKDPVKGGRVEHLGKWNIYRDVDSSVKVMTQETRGGSATIAFKCIDPEVESIIFWKSQRTPIDSRLDKVDYNFVYNESFVDAVVNNENWYLFSLIHHPEVHDAFSGDKETYNRVVEKALESGKPYGSIKARELLKNFLMIRQETGRMYCLNITRANEHTPFKDEIKQSNLCVSGSTLILTSEGYLEIGKNVGKEVDVWNGEEWSSTKIQKTGEDMELVKVSLEGGKELDCTPYHKFYLKCGEEVAASELNRGDELLTYTNPQGEEYNFVVKSVESLDGRHDTFCVTEPKKHLAVFNGILTGQCMEILQPTKPYVDMFDLINGNVEGDSKGEISFCGLSGVNYAKIDLNDVEKVVDIGVRSISNLIVKAPALYPTMKSKMLERMNVGLGINGLAECMYRNGFDYDGSKESLQFVKDLVEKHTFLAYKTSVEMVEDGTFPAVKGVDFNWLPIDTMKDVLGTGFKQDWESLRGKPRANSVLVSMQPMESSSVFFGGSNSVYPVRSRKIGKMSRKGVVQQEFLSFDESIHKTAWEIPHNVLALYYSVIQDFTDQAISADYYFDPRGYENNRKSLSEAMREWITASKLGVKTMYYLNTRIDNSESQINFEDDGCEDCKM